MNVYITRKLPDEVLTGFPKHIKVRMFKEEGKAISRDQLLTEVKGSAAILSLLTESIDGDVMDAAGPSLRIIANMAVGYDNIDVAAACERGIYVTNTPGVLTETTADLTFGLLLATARRIPEAERVLRNGEWQTWSPMLLTGQDVYGQTIGIVGMGRIGQAVARRALGFGMHIVYTGKARKPEVEKDIPCTYMSLEELCTVSDFIVPLTPSTPDTYHMIGRTEFQLMKKSAILINASRGDVVDEDALYDALRDRRIWAAGLDVFQVEPLPETSPLTSLPNVVLLPHIGSASIQTRLRMGKMAVSNIVSVLSGGRPFNMVP